MNVFRMTIGLCLLSTVFSARAEFTIDRSAMSEKYWEIWHDAEQAKIDAGIEKYRKADAVVEIDAPVGTDVKVCELEKKGGGGQRQVVSFRGFRGRYRLTWKDAEGQNRTKLVG